MIQTIKKVFRGCYYLSCFVILVAAITGAAYMGGGLKHVEIKEIEKIIPIEAPEPALADLLEEIPPKYGINSLIAKAVAYQESNGKKDAIRFEPHHMPRAAKITSDPSQQRMYASSHCAMQIMGWWAPKFDLSWADLYDSRNCVEVSMAILKDCMDRHKGKSKVAQLRGALTCYNGSEKYAEEVIARIGQSLMEETL